MKACKDCGVVQPLTEFYKHPKMADGHLNNCKACKKSYQGQYRGENLEEIRAYDTERSKTLERKQNRARNNTRRRRADPRYDAAHNAVIRAVQAGKLVKPASCEWCPRTDNIHGHHDDYDRPLDVIWLCPVCHRARHKQIDFLKAG